MEKIEKARERRNKRIKYDAFDMVLLDRQVRPIILTASHDTTNLITASQQSEISFKNHMSAFRSLFSCITCKGTPIYVFAMGNRMRSGYFHIKCSLPVNMWKDILQYMDIGKQRIRALDAKDTLQKLTEKMMIEWKIEKERCNKGKGKLIPFHIPNQLKNVQLDDYLEQKRKYWKVDALPTEENGTLGEWKQWNVLASRDSFRYVLIQMDLPDLSALTRLLIEIVAQDDIEEVIYYPIEEGWVCGCMLSASAFSACFEWEVEEWASRPVRSYWKK